MNNLLEISLPFHHPYLHTHHPIPNGHEGKSKKEAKSSSKLSQEGLEGVDKDLLLNLGVLGHGPKANRYLVFGKSPIVGLLFVRIQGVRIVRLRHYNGIT